MIDFGQFKTKAEVIQHLKSTKESCRTTAQAEEYLRVHLPKESYYQEKIIKHIRKILPSAFVWKAAAGPYSRQGMPDICAIINGRYYGFEVKRPFIGVLSKIQEQTIKRIHEAGGKAYVVTYPDEVTRILQKEISEYIEEVGGLDKKEYCPSCGGQIREKYCIGSRTFIPPFCCLCGKPLKSEGGAK